MDTLKKADDKKLKLPGGSTADPSLTAAGYETELPGSGKIKILKFRSHPFQASAHCPM